MASSQPPFITMHPGLGLTAEQQPQLHSELSFSAPNGHTGVTSRTHTNAQPSNNEARKRSLEVHEDEMDFIRVAIRDTAIKSLMRLESRKRHTARPRSAGSYVPGNDASPENVHQVEQPHQLEVRNKGSSSESDSDYTLDQESHDTSSDCEECQEPRNVPGDCKEGSVTYENHNMDDHTGEIYPTGSEQIPNAYDFEDLPLQKACILADLPGIQQGNSYRRDNSWTSSRTWVSEEEKERVRWRNIQKNMRHNGINSPFVPKTFEEYIEFRLEATELAKKAAAAQLRQLEEGTAMRGRDLSADKPVERQLIEKLLRSWVSDICGLPANSPWKPSADVDHHTKWPSYTEFNAAVNERAPEGHSGSLPTAGSGVTNEPTTEDIELHETNGWFQGLIERIDNVE
ncbi:hypothetical protein GGR58DRAFT_497423 [Xylaria digitata]|nr:hypothetical protein GGR58DRAFT_497423 [Xylaria digitata]